MKAIKTCRKIFAAAAMLWTCMALPAFADIYINVMAVNGSDAPKSYPIKFNLPGELTASDIVDTNGLQLDYNVDDGDYYVYGDVKLNPKESKTFRIHVRDKWMVTGAQVEDLKKQIAQGYETLGRPHNADKALVLKERLEKKLEYILNLQNNSAGTVDKRIDNYRSYAKEMKRIQNAALDVSYWRSDPSRDRPLKLIRLSVKVENPTKTLKHFKHKDYLPQETKVEDVVEAEDFEVRYDQTRQLAFLFKEEDLQPGAKKKYSIAIRDIWSIDQNDLDYLRGRSQYAFDYLKDTRFAESAKFLMPRIADNLNSIETSQAVQRPILEHISAFRANKDLYNDAQRDVEELEKLLAVFRENLEKSKVENILQKIQTLKSVKDVAKTVFNKKFETSTAWSYIAWILIFVGVLTFVSFIVWLLRAKDKKIENNPSPEKTK